MAENSLESHMIRVARKTVFKDILLPSDKARVSIYLEQGAEAVFFGIFSHTVLDVVLEQGARLEIVRVLAADAEGAGRSFLNIRQEKDSSCRSFFLTRGGSDLKDEVHVSLQGEGAEVFLNGLHQLAGDALADSHTFIDHLAANTTSDQLYKSVLRDRAYSVFNGRIVVRREAQMTNAYQLNKNLLLSDRARVDTKPELEIFADDVKCSHGAAVGQLDDDQLFYLQTRGIGRVQAGEMLVGGFIEDVLGKVLDKRLRRHIEGNI